VKILVAFGTRPEIVKLAPVTHVLARHGHSVRVVFTGQHTDPRLADDFLTDLGLVPDDIWNLPADEAARVGALLTAAYEELAAHPCDAVLLLGDTHTVPLFALAARRFGVPVVHVEAGLRSFNPRSLEESHRRTAAALASLHFAPTDLAARFLDAEGVDPRRVIVVGNPVTDTLAQWGPPGVPVAERAGVLFTAHRATNVDSDDGLAAIALTVARLAHDVGPVTFPVHPRTDARLRATGARAVLSAMPGVTLTAPLRYRAMLEAIASARVVVTDSGGLQEEASWFGVPVVVLRQSTPRWDGVLLGTTVLAGLDASRAVDAARAFSSLAEQTRVDAVPCPYGDGHVSERLASSLDDPAVLDLLTLDEPDLTAGLPAAVTG
jgi:UDP-N-acetylglucosamine 2-epimerase (non-hydrolysing)